MWLSAVITLLLSNHLLVESSNVSVYDSVGQVLDSITVAREAIERDYQGLVKQNPSPLSNWLAVSSILQQSTSAIIDKSLGVLLDSHDKLSKECIASLMEFVDDLNQQKNWTFRSKLCFDSTFFFQLFVLVLDANGLMSGILDGSFASFGNFDECLGIYQESSYDDIYGQYCLVKFNLDIPGDPRSTLRHRVYNVSGTSLEGTVSFSKSFQIIL